MSTFESDGWKAEETIAFIGIIKAQKDANASGSSRKINWQRVAREFAHSKGAKISKRRSISELRERYRKLKHNYYTAHYRNRSCEYYNYLKELLNNQALHEDESEDVEQDYVEEAELEEEDYGGELENKYAHTLEIEYNGDHARRSLSSSEDIVSSSCKWAEGELEAFLDIISTHKLQKPLMRKRNGKIFYLISQKMAKRNFSQLPDRLRLKFHDLKRQYAKARKTGESVEHFDELHALFQNSYPSADNSRAAELDTADSIDSDEDEMEPPMTTETDTEDALVASIPCNARCKWAEGEVDVFLEMITSMGLQTALLRKRNAKIFKLLSKEMAKRCFDKPPEKLRIKFQQLRRQYNKARRGGESFEYYEVMHRLLNPINKETDENGEVNQSSGTESDYSCSDGDAEQGKHKKTHPTTYYWTDTEVDAFLKIIKQQNLFRALDGSRKRNFKTLVYISNVLAKQNYKRTPHQLRNKLRLLTLRYREVKEGMKNVRIHPRHFEMLDDLMQKKRTAKPVKPTTSSPVEDEPSGGIKMSPKPALETIEGDSDESSASASSCDLLRTIAAEDAEDSFKMPAEPTPLEVLTSISEGQKQLLTMLSKSHETFLRQQREMQTQFLREMSNIMRQEREATFRMLRELIQPK